MNLSPEFIQTIKNTFDVDGETWLAAFPDLIAEASRRWELTEVQPVSNLSYNFVAFARRKLNREGTKLTKPFLRSSSRSLRLCGENANVVLKLGVPNRELTSEIAALRYYSGRGACRLLDADSDEGMLLLERLQPGGMLSELEDDGQATHIAADVMSHLWKSSNDFSRSIVTAPANFIQLRDWFNGFKRLRKRFDGSTGPLPKRLVETAEALSRELLAENKDETLLHGDFHHFNVLQSERGWLAIDPKGVVGPKGYEVGPLLINPFDRFLNGSNPKAQTEKRIAILSERLGMERERIRDWGICHAVLSAWWSLEDREDWEYQIRCAEVFQQVK
jgi:streptomycin 6-kinase